jgi:hypothetical protein
MPKFISDRDVEFFKSIARELVDDVVQNIITLFKINLNETKVNIYGEAMNKTWMPGVNLYALVDREPESARYEGFGADTDQNITFKVDRFKCEEINVYPEVGDVIFYNNSYFEIDNTTEIQFAGGQPYNNFSIVISTFMVSKSNLNIEERIK